MFILNTVQLCNDPSLASILAIIKRVMSLIQLIGPLVGFISLIINLIKLMANPEEKKHKKAIFNWLIAMFMLFLIPFIVNITMNLLDSSFRIASCWNYVDSSVINGQQSNYISDEDNSDNFIIIQDEDDYEDGGSNSSSSSSTHINSINNIRYNLYSQADSRWANYKYSSGSTIKDIGCMITSVAVVSSAYDKSINPYTVFNTYSGSHPHTSIIKLTSNSFSCKFIDTSSVKSYLNKGYPVVIKVYGKSKGGYSPFTSSQHYMALIDIKDDKIFVGNAYGSGGTRSVAGLRVQKYLDQFRLLKDVYLMKIY